jgi:enoyl-CoA hydratase/carnithine racemase
MDTSPVVLAETRVGVRVLTINRPEVSNALNPPVIEGLGAGLADADRDTEVRVVVVTGAGDRAFCAGMDLKDFAARQTSGGSVDSRNPMSSPAAVAYGAFLTDSISKPVIAAVNGYAVGGGFELMLACDLVVAAEHATFGLPEVRRGLIGASGSTQLARHWPIAIACEIALTGDRFDAQRALALGMINAVVPREELLDSAFDLAERVASNGPLAVQTTKKLIRQVCDAPRERIADLVGAARAAVFGSQDAIEGARAFAEKRSPNWTGR